MAVAVRVRAKVTGHRRRGERERDLTLALPAGPVTPRQIIEAAVTAEVAAYQGRAEEASLVRVLTGRVLRRELEQGAVRIGDAVLAGHEGRAAPVDVAEAVATALLAFDDGIFRVFVGDREAVGPVDLPDGADLLFLRLVPLAGG